MKNYIKLVIFLVAGTLVTSCASYTKSGPVLGVQSNSINTYVTADLDYDNAKRISGEAVSKKLFFFIPLNKVKNRYYTASNRYRGLGELEQQALYQAKSDNNVDIILEPNFEKETHCYFFGLYTTAKVTVNAWGANYLGLKEDLHGIPNPVR